MLDIDSLKGKIEITETAVECPVKNCDSKVERQRNSFRKDEKFRCPIHNIYISPSTFEYSNELENIIWKEDNDFDLLSQIKRSKRESRIARDNSEDAITWNVFRFLETNNLLCYFLKDRLGITSKDAELIYWSYSQKQENLWDQLWKAREEFELVPDKGSEPDLIIRCDNVLLIIEAKLTASNKTKPTNLRVERKYTNGGDQWWDSVFRSSFMTVASQDEKYELARFWLLGTWMANQLGLDFFYLINLTRAEKENDIEAVFGKHINANSKRNFKRITWEEIYCYILQNASESHSKSIMTHYFGNKAMGYNHNGILQKAFDI